MIAGIYASSVKTPLGRKSGTIELRTMGNGSVSGELVVKVRVQGLIFDIAQATYDADAFMLKGRVRHMLGTLPFTCRGHVEADCLIATASSGSFQLQIEGRRIEP